MLKLQRMPDYLHCHRSFLSVIEPEPEFLEALSLIHHETCWEYGENTFLRSNFVKLHR